MVGTQEADGENRYLMIENSYTAEQRAWEMIMGDSAATWREKLRTLWQDHPHTSASDAETSYLRNVYDEHCRLVRTSLVVWGQGARNDPQKTKAEIWRECVRTAKEDTIARVALLRERLLQRRDLINRTSLSKFIERKREELADIFRQAGLPDSLDEEAEEQMYYSLVSFAFEEAKRRVRLSEWLRLALMGIEYQGSWYRWLHPREHDRLK